MKYRPAAAVLAAFGLWALLRAGAERPALVLAVALVAAGVAFAVAHHALRRLTPYAVGRRTSSAASYGGRITDYLGRTRRLVGLLVDRTSGRSPGAGVAALVPAVAACSPGAPGLAGSADAGRGLVHGDFVALTMQGWWLPGRQLVVVLPATVLAIAWWARRGGGRLAIPTAALGAVGVLAQAWVSAEGAFDRLAWAVNLQSTSNPLYRAWTAVLPDYLTENAATWPLHWAWAAALAAAAVLAWRAERARSRPAPIAEAARAAA